MVLKQKKGGNFALNVFQNLNPIYNSYVKYFATKWCPIKNLSGWSREF